MAKYYTKQIELVGPNSCVISSELFSNMKHGFRLRPYY